MLLLHIGTLFEPDAFTAARVGSTRSFPAWTAALILLALMGHDLFSSVPPEENTRSGPLHGGRS